LILGSGRKKILTKKVRKKSVTFTAESKKTTKFRIKKRGHAGNIDYKPPEDDEM